MDLRVYPGILSGTFCPPASKSASHRALIACALARGDGHIRALAQNDDLSATQSALAALGAQIAPEEDGVSVCGIEQPAPQAVLNCGESGSTLRFLLPVASALGVCATFTGTGRLPNRPVDMLLKELRKNGCIDDYAGGMPFTVRGKLRGGRYEIDGSVSSQFVTGLLFALPLCEEDSQIILRGRLESRPYVDMTLAVLRRFGIKITETQTGWLIAGEQRYTPCALTVEGDWSGAAFFLAAGALGGTICCEGLDPASVQGDRAAAELLAKFGARVTQDGKTTVVDSHPLSCIDIDASDIPDLVPVLAATAAYAKGDTVITGAARLRIKESDRLASTKRLLEGLGGRVTLTDDGMVVHGGLPLRGGEADSCGDHRIAMAAAIAALGCSGPVVIRGAECVSKSYPRFFEQFHALGGRYDELSMG